MVYSSYRLGREKRSSEHRLLYHLCPWPLDYNAGNCYWKAKLKGIEDGGGVQGLPESKTSKNG